MIPGREQQDLNYLAARFNEKQCCLPVWGWRCSNIPLVEGIVGLELFLQPQSITTIQLLELHKLLHWGRPCCHVIMAALRPWATPSLLKA